MPRRWPPRGLAMAIAIAGWEAARRGGSTKPWPRSRPSIVGVRRVLSSSRSSPRLRRRFDRPRPLDLPPDRGPAVNIDKFGDDLRTSNLGGFVPLVSHDWGGNGPYFQMPPRGENVHNPPGDRSNGTTKLRRAGAGPRRPMGCGGRGGPAASRPGPRAGRFPSSTRLPVSACSARG